MFTITFDIIPFFFALAVLLCNIYFIGEDSSGHSGLIALVISVVTTLITYLTFLGIISLGGG